VGEKHLKSIHNYRCCKVFIFEPYLSLETMKMCGRLYCFIFKYLSVILKTESNFPLDLIYHIYYILSPAVTRQKSWSNDGKLGKFKKTL